MSFIQPEVLATSTASSAAAAAAAQEELKRKPTDHLYWAKTSSVNAAPPPKQLSEEEAKQLEASSSGAGGSAWNKGGNTWEEKKINTWVHELLQSELLPAMAYELPTASTTKLPSMPADDQGVAPDGLAVRVANADKVTGDCTYVLSRGKQRVVFELELKLKLEVEVRAAGMLQTIVTGVLHVHEVTNDDLTQPKLPDAKLTCDQGAEWQSAFEYAAKQSWPSLKSVLEALVARAKEKWR